MAATSGDTLFDAIDEGFDALFDAIKATEARSYTISKAVVEEARKGEKEAVELIRKWTDAPTSVLENLSAMVDVQTRAQQRVLNIVRDSFGGASDYGDDVQDAVRRMIRANADAGRATLEVARGAYTRLRDRDGEEPSSPTRARSTEVPVAAGTNANAPTDS